MCPSAGRFVPMVLTCWSQWADGLASSAKQEDVCQELFL